MVRGSRNFLLAPLSTSAGSTLHDGENKKDRWIACELVFLMYIFVLMLPSESFVSTKALAIPAPSLSAVF